MLQLDEPRWLLLLLVLPIWALVYTLLQSPRALRLPLNLPRPLPQTSRRVYLRHLEPAATCLAYICMVLALARPYRTEELQRTAAPGRDLLLVLDVSRSMQAQDLPPSRLEACKRTAAAFISRNANDRIGIVLFAEEAYAYVPLTTDRDYLQTQLRVLTPGTLPDQGTNLGHALGTALHHLPRTTAGAQAILLLTDGAGNRGRLDPRRLAMVARQHGIPIHTICIASKKNEARLAPEEQWDAEMLSAIARQSGGQFAWCESTQALEQAFQAIDAMPRGSAGASQSLTRLMPLHFPLMVTALLLLLAVGLLRWRHWFNPLAG